MNKLSDEQLNSIGREVFYEMFPDYTDKDSDNIKTTVINIVLTMIIEYIKRYQDEIEK